MALTLNDVAKRLKRIDEITLLELLGVTSEEIVEKFKEVIEEKYEYLAKEVAEITDDSYSEGNEWWETGGSND